MRDEFQLILASLRGTWLQVVSFLPRLLVALGLLIAGWLLARGFRRIVVRLFRLLRLDEAAEHAGLDDFLIRGGIRFTIGGLVGQTIYWGILLMFAVASFNLLGLTMGPELVARLVGYVPNVVAAIAVVVFGTLGARLIRGMVDAYLNNVGVREAARIGLLVHVAMLVFVALVALEQLGLAVSLLASAFQLAFGGLCLALALAFGLGGRTWAESILERSRSKR